MLKYALFFIYLSGCTQYDARSDTESTRKFEQVELSESVFLTIDRVNSNLRVELINNSKSDICIWENQWIYNKYYLISVIDNGKNVSFNGFVPSVVGEKFHNITIKPGLSISDSVDLSMFYSVKDWKDTIIYYRPAINFCD